MRRRLLPTAVLVSISLTAALTVAVATSGVAAAVDARVTEIDVTDAAAPHQFSAMAAAGDGSIWLADGDRPILTHLDATGTVLASLDLAAGGDPGGSLTGGFSALAVAGDGALWAAASGDRQIVRIDTSTTPVVTTSSAAIGDPEPSSLALRSDTEAVWTGLDSAEVYSTSYDAGTALLSTTTVAGLPADSAPAGVAVAADDSLWVTLAADSEITHLAADGSLLTTFESAPDPREIALTDDGIVWYTSRSGDAVGRVNPTTNATASFTMTALAEPRGITIGPDHHVWFGDAGRSRIGRVTPAGTITTFQLTAPSHVAAIATSADGRIWAASGESRVAHLATDVVAAEVPTVNGTSIENESLSVTTPQLWGTPPIDASTGQWRRCNAEGDSCVDIAGATGATYMLGAGDVGHTVVFVRFALNPAGTSEIPSAPSGIVTAAPPPPTTTTTQPPAPADPAPEPPAADPAPAAPASPPPPTPEQVRQFLLFVFFMAVLKARQAKRCRTVVVKVKGKRVRRQVCVAVRR